LNTSGQLGQGHSQGIDYPWQSKAIPLGWESIIEVSAGFGHTCALVDIGNGENVLKCWGLNDQGQLGHNNTHNKGDHIGEMGASLPLGYLGEQVEHIDAGNKHTCALLIGGKVACWGMNTSGQLGLGNKNNLGDGVSVRGVSLAYLDAYVDFGTDLVPIQISAGGNHSCILFVVGSIKCWGDNRYGQLGYGNTNNVGDDPNEMGDNLPFVQLGAEVVQITTGAMSTCVIFENGAVKCWGANGNGQLGQEHIRRIGTFRADEILKLAPIPLGTGKWALQLALGNQHTCAFLNDYTVKCWGSNIYGELGQGHNDNIGDNPDEMGDALKPIEINTRCSQGPVHQPGKLPCWE